MLNDQQHTVAFHLLEAVATGAETEAMVKELSGHECIALHNFLREADQLLKARWEEAGAPDPELLR